LLVRAEALVRSKRAPRAQIVGARRPFIHIGFFRNGERLGLQVIPLLKKFKAQDGLQTSKTLAYKVFAVDGDGNFDTSVFVDDNDAKSVVLATVPELVIAQNGYPLPINQLDTEQEHDAIYEVTVTWGDQQNKNNQQPVITFDTGGESQKITQSISTPGIYPAPGETVPDFNGAIGVTKDGIQGTDVPIACHKWTEKRYLSDSIVTPAWRIAVTLLSHNTNAAPFRGFDVDMVQFEHVSGSRTGTDLWEVTFYFAAGPHLQNFSLGQVTGISKKAWEYLWVLYEDHNDNRSNYLVKRPIAVYVEQVLWQGDFTTLAIPQGPIF
jgi:hypothetical protein